MAAKHPRLMVGFLALLAAGLSACDNGMRIGSWQVIDPKPPLVATRVDIVRWEVGSATPAVPAAAPAPATKPATQPGVAATQPALHPGFQKLTIDLKTGRGSFTDADGKLYPEQFEKVVTRKLGDVIAKRVWLGAGFPPPEGATQYTQYMMVAYNEGEQLRAPGFWSAPLKTSEGMFDDDKAAHDQARWTDPSRDPLPEDFSVLAETFDQALRVVHPLSEKVNLVK